MCVPGCQEIVAHRLSRRGFFKGLGAAGAGFMAAKVAPEPAFAAPVSFQKAIDLTHTLSEEFPTYFGAPQLKIVKKFDLAKDGFNLNEWMINEHTGTHMDAPFHFSKDGPTADLIAVQNLVVPLAIIDVTAKVAANADYQLMPEDVAEYEKANGAIAQGACVALRSGWDKNMGGPKFRNADDKGGLHFPGFHPDTAKVLLGKNVAGVAVDTLSLDHGMSKDFAFHYAWLGGGRWGLEAVANLAEVPVAGATLVVGSPKVKGATGGPSRVIALV